MVRNPLKTAILLCAAMAGISDMAWGSQHLVKRTTLDSPDPQVISWFGWRVAPVGDVNGDGVMDFSVSAPQQSVDGVGQQGVVFVFSGKDHEILFRIDNPVREQGARFGEAVASIGDLNGDGIADLVVGARLQSVSGNVAQGQARVFSGFDGTWLGVTLDTPVPEENAFFGASLAAVGDRNRAGILVGAPQQSFGDIENEGAAFLVSAMSGELISIILHPDPQAGASFGFVVESVGDIDGDSVLDFAIAAPFQDVSGHNDQGRVYVFSGRESELLYTLDAPEPAPTSRFGFAVVGSGDLDGDGVPDLVVGAPTSDIAGIRNEGHAYVFSGATGALLYSLADPTPLENGFFGAALASPGDIDGDGVDDIVVGSPAPVSDSEGTIHPGEVVLFSGASGEHLVTLDDPSPEAGASFGFSLSWIGDVDGDGFPDLLVGAPFHNVVVDGATNSAQGEAFIISGLAPDLKGKIRGVVRSVDETGRETLQWTVKVKNRGSVPITRPFKVKAHLSDDETFDGGTVDRKISKWKVKESVLPGDSLTLTGAVQVDESVSSILGKTLFIRVDSQNRIAEPNERNNIKSVIIPE